MADLKLTAEEQAQIDRAMAALDAMATTWAAGFDLRGAVRAMMALPDGEQRLIDFIKHAHGEGLYAGRMSPRPPPRAHTLTQECWCCPELVHKDPETGSEVWVHRVPQ